MKTRLYLLITALLTSVLATNVVAQNIGLVLAEDFNATTLPTGWTRVQTAGSDGWTFGQTQVVADNINTDWNVPGSPDATQFAISNDDLCNCAADNDQLNSPVMDWTGYDSAYVFFDYFYDQAFALSEAYFTLSYDGGATWLYLPLPADAAWVDDQLIIADPVITIDNVTYTFTDQMMIGFLHYDGDGWASGFAVDDVLIGGWDDPCEDIVNIPSCDAPQTVSLEGFGVIDWEFITGCGYTTFGDEQLYTFTPSVTGIHTLDVTSATGVSWLDYMYKPASLGCDTLDWICLGDANGVESYGMNLTAGTQYLILVDNEFIDAETQTFEISCPCTYTSLGGDPESETCNADLNGGCNNDPSPETYEPITCGQSISGTLWADGGNRDTDWFELVVTENTNIVVDYSGAMSINAVLIDNCTDFTVLDEATTTACGSASITYAAGPGTYVLALVPTAFESYPCGSGANDYDVTITYCAAPANDLCVNAEPLQCGASTVGTTVGSTSTDSPSTCFALSDDLGVWYSFMGTGGTVQLSTCGPVTDAASELAFIAVYDGTCGALNCFYSTNTGEDLSCGTANSQFLEFLTDPGVTYYVFVTAATGFPATIDFDLTLTCDPITGIESVDATGASVVVYPNPSNGTFTVEMNGAEGAAQLTVTDMVGKVVYSEAVVLTNDFRKGLDLNLSAGSYILNLASDKHNLIQKLEVR